MNINHIDLLLVEDNMDDAELTMREFKKHGMADKLYHVIDGEQALDFIFGVGAYSGERNILHQPKLVLLDIQMPKVTGVEVLKKMKADERTRSTPVVILTSSREDPDIKKCYDMGVNGYIVKPVHFENFAKAIKAIGFYWLLLNQPPA